MPTTHLPATLPDDALLREAARLVRVDREATAALVRVLMEVDARRLYFREGCSSLFVWCVQVLHLEEGAAYNRIEVARVARRLPAVLDALERGFVSLTAVRLLAPHLTAANHGEVLARARGLRKREVQRLVVELAPRPAVLNSIRQVTYAAAQRVAGDGDAAQVASAPSAARVGATDWCAPCSSMTDRATPAASVAGPHAPHLGPADTCVAAASTAGLLEARRSVTDSSVDDASAADASRVDASEPASLGAAGLAAAALAPAMRAPGTAQVAAPAVDALALLEAAGEGATIPHVSTSPTHGGGRVGPVSAGVAAPAVVPLSPTRYKLQLTITEETHAKLRLAQDLLRHTVPDGDLAEVVDRALTVLVRHLERQRFAATATPRPSRTCSSTSRYIPAFVRRAVWQRDEGQCAFVGRQGRCRERAWLEFHHTTPYAAGGMATVDNISLRCRAHNAFEASLFTSPDTVKHQSNVTAVADGADAGSLPSG